MGSRQQASNASSKDYVCVERHGHESVRIWTSRGTHVAGVIVIATPVLHQLAGKLLRLAIIGGQIVTFCIDFDAN